MPRRTRSTDRLIFLPSRSARSVRRPQTPPIGRSGTIRFAKPHVHWSSRPSLAPRYPAPPDPHGLAYRRTLNGRA
jgi:hypothetical protein